MSEPERIWRIIDIINWGTNYLQERGIDESRLTIEFMLCHILKCKRVDLYVNFDKPLSRNELNELRELIKRRLKREPLQYIIGETEFMGLKFKVTPEVLIPRPETELLVEKTIETIRNDLQQLQTVNILDIGTGSGNIAISIAKFVGEKVNIIGIDISEPAISIARENAERNQVKNASFILFDVFDDEFEEKFKGKFNIIVSNPPYVSADEIAKLQDEIKKYEPWVALTDGEDGLKFFRRIAQTGKNLIRERGFILVEMSYGQFEKVKEIFERGGYQKIEIFKDYLGIERVAKIKVERV